MENEELLLRNTFLNSQQGPMAEFAMSETKKLRCVVKWADSGKKNPLHTEFEDVSVHRLRKVTIHRSVPSHAVNPIFKSGGKKRP